MENYVFYYYIIISKFACRTNRKPSLDGRGIRFRLMNKCANRHTPFLPLFSKFVVIYGCLKNTYIFTRMCQASAILRIATLFWENYRDCILDNLVWNLG